MAKIIAPNKSYTGVSASVAFCTGEGQTTNKHLIEWFKAHGYEVIEDATEEDPNVPPVNEGGTGQKELKDMTIEELTAYAQEKVIDIGQATTQAGILKKIQDVEVTE